MERLNKLIILDRLYMIKGDLFFEIRNAIAKQKGRSDECTTVVYEIVEARKIRRYNSDIGTSFTSACGDY